MVTTKRRGSLKARSCIAQQHSQVALTSGNPQSFCMRSMMPMVADHSGGETADEKDAFFEDPDQVTYRNMLQKVCPFAPLHLQDIPQGRETICN